MKCVSYIGLIQSLFSNSGKISPSRGEDNDFCQVPLWPLQHTHHHSWGFSNTWRQHLNHYSRVQKDVGQWGKSLFSDLPPDLTFLQAQDLLPVEHNMSLSYSRLNRKSLLPCKSGSKTTRWDTLNPTHNTPSVKWLGGISIFSLFLWI